ncbi:MULTISPECIES: FecR family protein [Pseudoalteromonas]|uniref:FecR family protein n=1 Tax=Pseudoalteromonas TaxID=53246 RepID=UPI001E35FA5A|nr:MULTISPECIES: FecR family protein [Pseudoalteromonas]
MKMDRHQTQLQLQQQANAWLEQQKTGLSKNQQHAFLTWLNTNPEHLAAYQQSQQVDQLLTQFSDSDITQLNISTTKRVSPLWAIAACVALFMVSITSYQFWPQNDTSAHYSAQYQSARSEQFDVALPDGSQLSLDAQTHLTLAFDANQRVNNLIQGRALFDVASDPQRPFIVIADNTKITVLGTRFSVDKKQNSTRISVEHGRVKVQNKQHLIELVQGQQVLFNEQGMAVQNVNPHLVAAWRDGRLIFNNAPLDEVFAEFNRYHDTHFEFTDSTVSNMMLSGTFSATDLDNFLNLLPHVLPVEIKNTNNHIVISKI